MEVKTKTKQGIDFTVNGSSNHDSGKVTGSLESKYKYSDYGMWVFLYLVLLFLLALCIMKAHKLCMSQYDYIEYT